VPSRSLSFPISPGLPGWLPALAHLYRDPHRAFFRLLVDDLIARRHFRHIYDEETWPSHIACGDTKSGKSLMPIEVCRLFGWTYRRMRKFLPKETEKSMRGRRIQRPAEPGSSIRPGLSLSHCWSWTSWTRLPRP
jgi:hypothetical protein